MKPYNRPGFKSMLSEIMEDQKRVVINYEPDLKIAKRKDYFYLSSPMIVTILGVGKVEIPVDFHTNFASIPWWARWAINVNGRHRLASIVHDFLYTVNGHRPNGLQLTRKMCDDIFFWFMQYLGVPEWKRIVMYYAVRLGGRPAWKSKPLPENKFLTEQKNSVY